MDKITIFVCYSREDGRWLDEKYQYPLILELAKSLRRNGVELWFDRGGAAKGDGLSGLEPGDAWRKTIEEKIDEAQIAILLISEGFLSSKFIEEAELPRIKGRWERRELSVVPILLEPCEWEGIKFLSDLQMMPGKPTPLINYTANDREWAYARSEILTGIRKKMQKIQTPPPDGQEIETPNPPPPIAPPQQAPSPISTIAATRTQIRPWVRCGARMIDIFLFSMIMGFVLVLVYEPIVRLNDNLLGILILLVYLFVEPYMLSSWGTTPGKALLNIQVRKNNGDKPTYAEAFKRVLNVVIRGLGFGIPIVTLITMIYAYIRLNKDKITSWDKEGGFTVTHHVLGAGRVIAAILIILAIFFIIGFSEMQKK